MTAPGMTNGADRERLARALGQAVVDAWSDLPARVQHRLFEAAVLAGHRGERDESLREQLAQFLHAQHPRTAPVPDADEASAG